MARYVPAEAGGPGSMVTLMALTSGPAIELAITVITKGKARRWEERKKSAENLN